jgi:hypothetical protein
MLLESNNTTREDMFQQMNNLYKMDFLLTVFLKFPMVPEESHRNPTSPIKGWSTPSVLSIVS